MESVTVEVCPLRFAFAVQPKDKASLQKIFEVNSSLWERRRDNEFLLKPPSFSVVCSNVSQIRRTRRRGSSPRLESRS
jgi:hypothetical protein